MRKSGLSWCGIAAVFVLAFGQAEASGQVRYGLKLEKGRKYYVRRVTEQKIFQIAGGQQHDLGQTLGFGADFDVQQVDPNGDALIRQTYRWVKLVTKGPLGEITYDSSKQDAAVPQVARGFAAFLGESFSLKLTPSGRVTEVKGLDKVRSNITKKLAGAPGQEEVMKAIELYLADGAVMERTGEAFAVYPKRAVVVGDTWTTRTVLSYGFPIILENRWTLRQRRKGIATIEVSSTVKPNPAVKPLKVRSALLSYELSGKDQGVIVLDEATGLLRNSKRSRELSGKMKVEVSVPKAEERIIPIKIAEQLTIEISEREE